MLLPSPTWAISVLAGALSSCRGQECPYFALRQLLPTDQFEGLESPYAVLGACPLWVRSGHQSAIELVRLVPEADVTRVPPQMSGYWCIKSAGS